MRTFFFISGVILLASPDLYWVILGLLFLALASLLPEKKKKQV
jgi:hypothetical protein